MGINGVIEFGNRTLTFVVAIIAIAGFVLARRQRPARRRVVRLSVLAGLGIPAQAVVGGMTVITGLQPWVVGVHFLASMAVIAAAYAFWVATVRLIRPVCRRCRCRCATSPRADRRHRRRADRRHHGHRQRPARRIREVARNGIDPQSISQVPRRPGLPADRAGGGDLVRLPGGTAGPATRRTAWFIAIISPRADRLRAVRHPPARRARRRAHGGACAVWLGTLSVLYATRTRPASTPPRPPPERPRPPLRPVPVPPLTARRGPNRHATPRSLAVGPRSEII
jgi:cytochrome c oxidase assembly protein subunit 15